MPEYVEVPASRLSPQALRGLLEEFVTRDGTDYGERERSLQEKMDGLLSRVQRGEVRILYESEGEQWDFVAADVAASLLDT
ncbi:MAG: hypothetical protein CME59_09790 [Halioglobus sp.]|nr:hypothetical protein [Halioglobus sp.]